jgi:hypothetical protein
MGKPDKRGKALHDEPAVPEVVRWIADEVTALLFDDIVAGITAED